MKFSVTAHLFNKLKMFLVTGGNVGQYWSDQLDSTETFDPLVGIWTASGAKLAMPMIGLKAETINGRLLIFGINNVKSS